MERLQLYYGSDSDDNGSDNDYGNKDIAPGLNVTQGQTSAENNSEPVDGIEVLSDDNGDNVNSSKDTESKVNETKDIELAEDTSESLAANKLLREQAHSSDESRTDFFGLLSAEDDKDETEGQPETDRHTAVVNIDGKEINVGIPSSRFWSDVGSSDLQVLNESSSKFVLDKRKPIDLDWKQIHKTVKKNPRITHHTQKNRTSAYADSTCMSEKSVHGKNVSIPSSCKSGAEMESITNRKLFFIHSKIQPLLHTSRQRSQIPSAVEWTNPAHGGAVNRIKWNTPAYSHLLASCSMDSAIKIWNPWTQLEPCVQVVRCHNKAVRDIAWSRDGNQLLSCSYDKSAVVTDVEKGTPLCRLRHDSYTTCGKFHPTNPSYCLTGCTNEILAWDIRSPETPFRKFRYKDNIGQVQDLLFPDDASSFFSCSDLVSRDSADRNLMAWDFKSGVTLSNQIYQERYTITRLKQHPTDGHLLAQSNGNYIARFSVNRPYKMDKSRRFGGHKLLGYSVGFDISLDGASVISGSCDGNIFFYDYRSAKILRKLSTNIDVVTDVACHPLLPSTLACCGWDGSLQVWR